MLAYGYITKWTIDAQSAPTPTATPRTPNSAEKDPKDANKTESSKTDPNRKEPALSESSNGGRKEKRLLDRVARLVVLCNKFAEGRAGEPLQVRIFSVLHYFLIW